MFIRGNPNNPGASTPPRFLICLGGERQNLSQTAADGSNWRAGHHRSRESADCPRDGEPGLDAPFRLRTGADAERFRIRGDPPTHPELLDYLALKFVESGWSLKKLHRLIMTSAAYRQASADNEAARKVDPENQLLWRMNRRRLEIESLRDSMLAAAGRLDLTAGRSPVFTDGATVGTATLGVRLHRTRPHPGLLSAFDFASPDQHAPLRFVTTVPQQALFFLNSPFVAEQSRGAGRARRNRAAATPSTKIAQLYRLVFGREPGNAGIGGGLQVRFRRAARPGRQRRVIAVAIRHGRFDAADGRVTSFTPFPTFVSDRWQGGGIPAGCPFGKAVLRAAGGEPGEQPDQAVIRRWVSPVSGTMSIEGTLRHGQPAVPYGDGVRGRIVSSRHGELASWSVNGRARKPG